MKRRVSYLFSLVFTILMLQASAWCQLEGGCLIDPNLAPILINEISGERALDYVTRISRFHRIRGGGPGSGFNEAVDYVVQELNKFGLDDVHVERFKSDGFKTYLRWESPVGWRVKSAKLWLMEPQKELLADFSHIAVSLMAYSQGGKAQAEVVYVGEGTSDTDYKNVDVQGKIVFATGGAGDAVHRQAVINRGAVGVVVGPSNREDRLEYPDLVELERLYIAGEEREKAGWGFSLSRRQTNRILRLIGSGVNVRMRAEVNAELFDGEMPVISAMIEGRTYPDEEILIMGHLDHYKPGANDNASGSAGMMEIARSVTTLIQSGEMETPHRSIRFLWLPEMHGAVAYAENHPEISDHTLVGINLDMIGEDYHQCRAHLMMTRPPFSSPSYLGDVVEDMLLWVDKLNMFSPRGSFTRLNYRDVGYSGGSDHVIFTDHTIGVPSLMLVHSDVFHHTSYDTPEKCDPTELRRVITAAIMAALVIANAQDEKAIDIAAFGAEKGLERLHRKTRISMASLRNLARTDEFHRTAPKLNRNIQEYTEIIGEVEALAVKSCEELCQGSEAKKVIDDLAKDLEMYIEAEKKRIDRYYQFICNGLKFGPSRPTMSDAEKNAEKIIPERQFRGPLPGNFLIRELGERYHWYRENARRIGGNISTKLYEINNLADGNHNLLWIRDAISAQFGETDIEFLIRYVEDLKSLNLMDW